MSLEIEIICPECIKCENLKKRIDQALKMIQIPQSIVKFTHTKNLKRLLQFSIGPTQTPALLLNGKLEFAGGILPSPEQIGKRIKDVRMRGEVI